MKKTKIYVISYTHSLGAACIPCHACEVAGILRNMCHLAMQGHSFSNVSITRS